VLKQRAAILVGNKNRDGHHAIHLRPDLGSLSLHVSRRDAAIGGGAMIEIVVAVLVFCSVGIFLAHAFDAYHTG
jgi:hypothetical protein